MPTGLLVGLAYAIASVGPAAARNFCPRFPRRTLRSTPFPLRRQETTTAGREALLILLVTVPRYPEGECVTLTLTPASKRPQRLAAERRRSRAAAFAGMS